MKLILPQKSCQRVKGWRRGPFWAPGWQSRVKMGCTIPEWFRPPKPRSSKYCRRLSCCHIVPGPARNTSHYSVRLDLTQKLREHPDSDIIGPGFAGLIGIKLQTRTRCYVTYCNREIQLSLGYWMVVPKLKKETGSGSGIGHIVKEENV